MAKLKQTLHKLEFETPSLGSWTVTEPEAEFDDLSIAGAEYTELAYWTLDSSKKIQFPQQVIRAINEDGRVAGWELEVVSNIEV